MRNIITDEECMGLNLDQYDSPKSILELSCIPNKLNYIHALIKLKFKLEFITDVTGLSQKITYQSLAEDNYSLNRAELNREQKSLKNLANRQASTLFWNPIHFAIYNDHELYVRYFFEQLQEPLSLGIRDPEYLQKISTSNNKIEQYLEEIYMVVLCANKKNFKVFDYLVNERGQYWNYQRLKYLVRTLIELVWKEGIRSVLLGQTFKTLYGSFTVKGRFQMLEEIIDPLFDTLDKVRDQVLINDIVENLKTQPFISVSFFNIIKGHYYNLKPDNRDDTLKQVVSKLYRSDIVFLNRELQITDLQPFIKELSQTEKLFNVNNFKQFQIYIAEGMLNKDKEFEHYYNDLLTACRDKALDKIEALLDTIDGKNFNRARENQPLQMEILHSDQFSTILETSHWGPLLQAFGYKNMNLFIQIITRYRFNLSKEVQLDPDNDVGETTSGQFNEILLFLLVIHQKSIPLLQVIISPMLNFLWKVQHIKLVCEVLKAERWYDGLQSFISSSFSKQFFSSIKYQSHNTKQELIKSMLLPMDDPQIRKDDLVRVHYVISQRPYSIHTMIYILENIDFLQESIQKDLLIVVKTCNENIIDEDIKQWLVDQKRSVASLILVKDFMIRGLDDQSLIKMNLMNELDKFIQMVRKTDGYAQLEEEADFNSQGQSFHSSIIGVPQQDYRRDIYV
ncbi:UNKNOWN [Stylonychia lemnae]|uniref:Uncharacterized protein n=1 Tax=Stylonychia lemnae TaxID=5949 RepID=A0A078ACX3_STYLE|nr:UNKNOWN [Stylonychia lemnae]|eukprot:CDW79387.1 UNKNOWN [Stylonychia lemnae]